MLFEELSPSIASYRATATRFVPKTIFFYICLTCVLLQDPLPPALWTPCHPLPSLCHRFVDPLASHRVRTSWSGQLAWYPPRRHPPPPTAIRFVDRLPSTLWILKIPTFKTRCVDFENPNVRSNFPIPSCLILLELSTLELSTLELSTLESGTLELSTLELSTVEFSTNTK